MWKERGVYILVIVLLLAFLYTAKKDHMVIEDTVNYRNRNIWPTKAYDRYYYY